MPLARTTLSLQTAWERWQRFATSGTRRSRDRADKVCDELVEALAPLIVRHAHALRGCGLEKDDLVAIGQGAVFRAITRYAPRYGTTFKTFVYAAVRGEMLRAIERAPLGYARLPVYLRQVRRAVRKAEELLLERGEAITPRALARETCLPLRHVETALWTLAHSQETLRFGGDVLRGEIDPERHPAFAVEWTSAADARLLLQSCWHVLTEEEQEVLLCRFEDGTTLRVLGKERGLSGERIRQIEAKALAKLRRCLQTVSDD